MEDTVVDMEDMVDTEDTQLQLKSLKWISSGFESILSLMNNILNGLISIAGHRRTTK